MKKIFTIICILVCVAGITQQPPKKGMMANIQGLKIAYITKELNLSTEEAQKFWPVYYSFLNELKQTRQNNTMNEIAFEEASLVVKKKYLLDFKKVLGTDERANKIFSIERSFAAEVRKELEKRQQLRKQFRK